MEFQVALNIYIFFCIHNNVNLLSFVMISVTGVWPWVRWYTRGHDRNCDKKQLFDMRKIIFRWFWIIFFVFAFTTMSNFCHLSSFLSRGFDHGYDDIRGGMAGTQTQSRYWIWEMDFQVVLNFFFVFVFTTISNFCHLSWFLSRGLDHGYDGIRGGMAGT